MRAKTCIEGSNPSVSARTHLVASNDRARVGATSTRGRPRSSRLDAMYGSAPTRTEATRSSILPSPPTDAHSPSLGREAPCQPRRIIPTSGPVSAFQRITRSKRAAATDKCNTARLANSNAITPTTIPIAFSSASLMGKSVSAYSTMWYTGAFSSSHAFVCRS